MQKQVDSSHYEFSKYVDKRRWASIWHQLDEVITMEPTKVLEIGPGPGIFKAVAQAIGVRVETLDLDEELQPDHVASADDTHFDDNAFDVVCAFQMLEHVPYEQSILIFKEMARVADKYIVISIPDARAGWPYSIHIPIIGDVKFTIPLPWQALREHTFDGEHYWELNKKGYSFKRVGCDFEKAGSATILKSYRVPEKPYHRFFIFRLK